MIEECPLFVVTRSEVTINEIEMSMLGTDLVLPLLATKLINDSPCHANGLRTDIHCSFDDCLCHGLPDKSVEDLENQAYETSEDDDRLVIKLQVPHCLPSNMDVTEVVGSDLTCDESDSTDLLTDKVVSMCASGITNLIGGFDSPGSVAHGDFGDLDCNTVYSEQVGSRSLDEVHHCEDYHVFACEVHANTAVMQSANVGHVLVVEDNFNADDESLKLQDEDEGNELIIVIFSEVVSDTVCYPSVAEIKTVVNYRDNAVMCDLAKIHNFIDHNDSVVISKNPDSDLRTDVRQLVHDVIELVKVQLTDPKLAPVYATAYELSPSTGSDVPRVEVDSVDSKSRVCAYTTSGPVLLSLYDPDIINPDPHGKASLGVKKQCDCRKCVASSANGTRGEDAGCEHACCYPFESLKCCTEESAVNSTDVHCVLTINLDRSGEDIKVKVSEKSLKPMLKTGHINYRCDHLVPNLLVDVSFVENVKVVNSHEIGHQSVKAGKLVDKDERSTNLQMANVHHELSTNATAPLVVTSQFLPPDLKVEDVVNHGGTGVATGYETGYGPDDQGLQHDGDGKSNNRRIDEDCKNPEVCIGVSTVQHNGPALQQSVEKHVDELDKVLYANGVSITGENTGDPGGANTVSKVHVPVSGKVVGKVDVEEDGLFVVTKVSSSIVFETDGPIGSQCPPSSHVLTRCIKNCDESVEQHPQTDLYLLVEPCINGTISNADSPHDVPNAIEGDVTRSDFDVCACTRQPSY